MLIVKTKSGSVYEFDGRAAGPRFRRVNASHPLPIDEGWQDIVAMPTIAVGCGMGFTVKTADPTMPPHWTTSAVTDIERR